MSRVVKRRLYIIIALVMSVMMIIAALPSGWSDSLRVKAAGFNVNAKNVYFDTYNLPNKDIWLKQDVYLQIQGWNDLQKGKRINGTDIIYWDFTSNDLSSGGQCIIILGSDWDYINSHDFYRTTVSSFAIRDIQSNGQYCTWAGNVSDINGHKVYNITSSSTAVDHSPKPEIYDEFVQQPQDTRKVYFDATFSKLSYEKDVSENGENMPKNVFYHSMPYQGDRIYYYAKNSYGTTISGKMWREGTTDLWYAYIPTGFTKIRFTSWNNPRNENAAANGDGTGMTDIPTDITEPTFCADTGDTAVYVGGNRGGYWKEKDAVKVAPGNENVVPLTEGSFTEKADTLYLNSTIYDYYSDYELNGNNRVDYPVNVLKTDSDNHASTDMFPSYRNWVPFRQLAQALSDYYKDKGVPSKNTIYTGHFQPTVEGWGYIFSGIGDTLNLYGWSGNDNQSFQANNNSCKSINSSNDPKDAKNYRYATQGIAANELLNGNIAMSTSNGSVEMPFFSSKFLGGSNSKNAKLGEVYENAAFPFTKVDRDNNGIYYWSFDSAATTLKLRKNNNDDTKSVYPYYLETMRMTFTSNNDNQDRKTEASRAGSENIIRADRNATESATGYEWSKNLVSSGAMNKVKEDKNNNISINDYPSNKYGYLPLNSEDINETKKAGAAKYNYGFGTKLEFEFGLTNDGNIVTTNKNGERVSAATTFNFSGDDDVWVFVDDKLVLDIGGDHGRTSGCINFSKATSYDYVYTYKKDDSNDAITVKRNVPASSVFVSDVKDSANNPTKYSNSDSNTLYVESLWDKLGISGDDAINKFYKEKHTLKFYYMERGMWESNLRIQFNFPEHDTIEVSKKLDKDDVNPLFYNFFANTAFDFKITNLVTHYGTERNYVEPGYSISQADIRDYGSALGPDSTAGTAPTLMAAAGAYYDLETATAVHKGQQLNNQGIVTLHDNESALFSKQFRRGSYIGVEETLPPDCDPNLYTTSWVLTEKGTGNTLKSGEGLKVNDGRIEPCDYTSGGSINDYIEEKNPGAILLRAHSSNAADINLDVAFTNKVNTGSLKVVKMKADGSEDISGPFTFTVKFTDIGGYKNSAPVTKQLTINKLGEEGAQSITGIPVGTAFSITEAAPRDGSVFDSVTSSDDTSTVSAAAARTITGVIGYVPRNNSKGEEETVTFTNKKQKEVISITVTKKWENIKGVTLPESVNFQLQRKTGNGQWEAVDNYRGFSLTKNDADATGTVSFDSTATWSKTIENLDKYSTGTTPYYYRILEYSADGSLMEENSMNFSPNYVAVYSNLTGVASTDNAPALTVTNTYSAIVMPETGAAPLFNFAMIGISAVGIAFIALLIYKRKLQTADVNTGERGGLNK